MITPEQFYSKLEPALKEQNYSMASYSFFISDMVGKRIELKRTKSKKRFPDALAIPFMDLGCFTDDELYYVANIRLDMLADEDEETQEKLEDFIAELEPSKAMIEKQRIRRKMAREVA